MEEILPYKCRCGGILKKSKTQVEFFGIDFGIKSCEVCTSCQAEYLDEKVMEEVEITAKKKGLFGLEQNITITKSGNSLVLRIPPEVAKFTDIQYKDKARIFPISKKRIEIELI